MPSDLLQAHLQHTAISSPECSYAQLLPLDSARALDLADAYFTAYPPGMAAASRAEAREEMASTFTQEYGKVLENASFMAVRKGKAVGAIMVVAESIWEEQLSGPFIIDLFTAPAHQGYQLGRSLIAAAMLACKEQGARTLSLRVGEGTSPAAHRLYAQAGFLPIP